MPLHVGEMVSDVTAEAAPQPASPDEKVKWQELERFRNAHAQMTRDRRRTEAERYDD